MPRGRPPYPGLLTPREEEVLELLRQGLSNPEIAKRLGITPRGAAYHVSEILSKLQVSSREEAAAWRPEAEPAGQARRVPMPAFLMTTLQRLATGTVGKVAGATLIGVAAVAMALLALGVFEMSQREASPADATATAQAQSPEATPEPEDGDGPLRRVSDGFVRRDLAPGEAPQEEHGILFVDVATGAGELWVDPQLQAVPGDRYDIDDGQRWLVSTASSPEPRFTIADRHTGAAYLLDLGRWRVRAGPTPHGLLLVQENDDVRRFQVVDLASAPTDFILEFSLPSAVVGGWAVFLASGDRLLVQGYLVEMATGNVSRITDEDLMVGLPPGVYPLDDGGALVVEMLPARGGGIVARASRFDADGDLTSALPLLVPPQATDYTRAKPSPDGRWLAVESSLLLDPSHLDGVLHGPGSTNAWPVVWLVDLQTNQAVLRAIRVSMYPNPGQQLGWLDDSSGLVVATPGGFSVLRTNGELEALPFGPVRPYDLPLPVPAGDPDRFLYASRLYDGNGGALSREVPETWDGSAGWGRYQADLQRGEIAVVQSHAPFRDVMMLLLSQPFPPALIQKAPFHGALQMRVATTGDLLNIRDAPGEGSAIVGSLQDGTVVALDNAPGGDGCPVGGIVWVGCSIGWDSSLQDPDVPFWVYDVPLWLYVRAQNGLEGWVSAEYLVWAD